jgi:hypothetical protein
MESSTLDTPAVRGGVEGAVVRAVRTDQQQTGDRCPLVCADFLVEAGESRRIAC